MQHDDDHQRYWRYSGLCVATQLVIELIASSRFPSPIRCVFIPIARGKIIFRRTPFAFHPSNTAFISITSRYAIKHFPFVRRTVRICDRCGPFLFRSLVSPCFITSLNESPTEKRRKPNPGSGFCHSLLNWKWKARFSLSLKKSPFLNNNSRLDLALSYTCWLVYLFHQADLFRFCDAKE